MPHNSLGSIPVYESIKHNIPVYAVKENHTVLDVTKEKLFSEANIIETDSYQTALKTILEG